MGVTCEGREVLSVSRGGEYSEVEGESPRHREVDGSTLNPIKKGDRRAYQGLQQSPCD